MQSIVPEQEQWKAIAEFDGLYEISSTGRVKSLARVVPYVDGRAVQIPERILRSQRRRDGYLYVTFKVAQVTHNRAVHRLVAEAFVPGKADGLDVCHFDGDKLNNSPSNLRWDTRSANIKDQVRHGSHHEASKTHCRSGHPYVGDNVRRWVTPSGSNARCCRSCERERSAARRANGVVATRRPA